MLPLTKKELKSNEDAKKCYICGKWIQKNAKDINYRVRYSDIRYHLHYTRKQRGPAHSI